VKEGREGGREERQTYLDDLLADFPRPTNDKGVVPLHFESLSDGHDEEEEEKEDEWGGAGVACRVRRSGTELGVAAV